MAEYLKDPAATLRYAIDWTSRYLTDDTIVSANWSISPSNLEGLVVAGSEVEGNITRVRLSGGKPGYVYRVTNQITLASGDVDERAITIRIGDR